VGDIVVRIHVAGVLGLGLLTGCVSVSGLLSNDVAGYGVRVIRPGMSEREVQDLIGAGESKQSVGKTSQSEVSYGSGLHIKFDAGAVDCCWAERATTTGVDAELAAMMKPGMEPAEVAAKLGPPTFGYASRNGLVVLHYAGRGVEVSFNDGRLASWWPTRDRPSDNPAAAAISGRVLRGPPTNLARP
jgi:hypothetical protein